MLSFDYDQDVRRDGAGKPFGIRKRLRMEKRFAAGKFVPLKYITRGAVICSILGRPYYTLREMFEIMDPNDQQKRAEKWLAAYNLRKCQ